MSKIINTYKKSLLVRYDKDPAIPYFNESYFPGLKKEEFTFDNRKGINVKYFYYYYDNFQKDKVILFCHGIGPGHTAYLREIEYLAKNGYKVLTLDYSGSGESGGETMSSFYEPTRDVCDLIKHLNLKEEIMMVGHSLGAFTALNIINLFPQINVGVIMSGFISMYHLMKGLFKFSFIAKKIDKYEREAGDIVAKLDNLQFLKGTKKKILFIHSKDDNVVNYKTNTYLLEKLNNPSLSFLIVDNHLHNPNYRLDSVKYMSSVIGKYSKLVKSKKLVTLEEKKDYFKDVDLYQLTEQDDKVWGVILPHLAHKN